MSNQSDTWKSEYVLGPLVHQELHLTKRSKIIDVALISKQNEIR